MMQTLSSQYAKQLQALMVLIVDHAAASDARGRAHLSAQRAVVHA